MKIILSSIVSVATLCLTSAAHSTGVFMDNLNYNYVTHQKHITNNQNIMAQQFHEYGFTVDRVHTHNELENLTDTIYIKANEAISNYEKEHKFDRQEQEFHMVRRTEFGITWKEHDRRGKTLGSVKDTYKIHPSGLKSSHNSTILDSVARLMQTDKTLHMKNDMVFDYWEHYKTWNLYSIDRYFNIWPNDKDNINHIQTLTLLNGSATVHVWQSALKIDPSDESYRAKAKQLEETTKPDISFKIQYGDTMLMHPFVRFTIEDEGSRNQIRFLVNEYARYDEKLFQMSIDKNVFTTNNIDIKKSPQMIFREQGFIVNKTHDSAQLQILQYLAQTICNEASEAAKTLQKRKQEKNKDSNQIRFEFVKKKDGKETISGKWGARDGVEGYVKNIYKHDLFVSTFIQNNNILTTVSELLGCKVQDMDHVRNDIVSDQWIKVDNNITLNKFGLYKIYQCDERDKYNMWQIVIAITVFGADVDLHVWPETMSIGNDQKGHRNEARALRKATKSTHSVRLDAGSTFFISPFAEFAVTPREELSKKVCFYVNGFAYPETCKVEK